MKHTMTKAISVIMVLILLLGAFAGCGDAMYGDKNTTPSVNAGASPGDSEATSKIKEAIDDAWMKNRNEELIWYDIDRDGLYGARYYGTFNGFDIIFKGSLSITTADGCIYVANYDFRHPVTFQIFAYKNGEFTGLKEAYEKSWLTESQIKEIYDIHWYEYQKKLFPVFYENYESLKGVQYPSSYIPPVDKEYLEKLEARWLEEFGYKIKWRDIERQNYDGAGYYGTFNDCFVIFEPTTVIEGATDTLIIGQYKFLYPEKFVMLIYTNGEFCTLEKAFLDGILIEKYVDFLSTNHAERVQSMYPEFYQEAYENQNEGG